MFRIDILDFGLFGRFTVECLEGFAWKTIAYLYVLWLKKLVI